MSSLPISLCMFVKNEENNIAECIESALPLVSEVVIVDTGSTDRTLEIARTCTDRVYSVKFSDFGSIRTLTAHLSNREWVLMLDADERLYPGDWHKFVPLIDQPRGVQGDTLELDSEGNPIIDSWAFPRKRWADKSMRNQVELESYPDWQVRLFRNHVTRKKISFRRRVHETVVNCIRTEKVVNGPTIHHFQNVDKGRKALQARQKLYTKLYEADLADGVYHEEPPVVDMDKV